MLLTAVSMQGQMAAMTTATAMGDDGDSERQQQATMMDGQQQQWATTMLLGQQQFGSFGRHSIIILSARNTLHCY
jgi:hypothetical protein